MNLRPCAQVDGQNVVKSRQRGVRGLVQDDPRNLLASACFEFRFWKGNHVGLPVEGPPVAELNRKVVAQRHHASHHQRFLQLGCDLAGSQCALRSPLMFVFDHGNHAHSSPPARRMLFTAFRSASSRTRER